MNQRSGVPRILLAFGPLVILGLMVWWFLTYGLKVLAFGQLPVEKLGIERITFRPGEIILKVRNEGPTEAIVAQIFVNEAMRDHSVLPDRTLSRFEATTIYIAFDWIPGEPYVLAVISGAGIRYERAVDIATETPKFSPWALGVFGLLGVYVGVLPVFLGILWLPFFRTLSARWVNFLMSFTVGLLVFLGIDTLDEALEILERVPGAFNGLMLIAFGALAAFLGLATLDSQLKARVSSSPGAAVYSLSFMIAIGIGLHNLGEGLAIGAAFTLGEVALGSFLIIGFTVHNTTEGLAIISPLVRQRANVKRLIWLGVIAGAPAILGTWIGVFTYSDPFSLLFLGLGGGAIFQVVWVLLKARMKKEGQSLEVLTSLPNFGGLMTGFLAMYVSSLLVAA